MFNMCTVCVCARLSVYRLHLLLFYSLVCFCGEQTYPVHIVDMTFISAHLIANDPRQGCRLARLAARYRTISCHVCITLLWQFIVWGLIGRRRTSFL